MSKKDVSDNFEHYNSLIHSASDLKHESLLSNVASYGLKRCGA